MPQKLGQEQKDIVEQIYLIRFALVATMALLVYEYLLTFKDEKRLVWPSKFSAIKIVFILNRYLPFVATAGLTYVIVSADVKHDDHVCKPGFLFFGSLVFLTYVVAEFILYVRAYAAWGRNRSVGIVLLLTLIGVYALGTTYIAIFFRSLQVIKIHLMPTGCSVAFRNQVAWVSVIVLIGSETFALALLLARSPRLGQSKIKRVLVADGITYYVFILASSVMSTAILRLAPANLCDFLLATQGALHSIFCSRLLLNIRGAYESASVAVCTISVRGGAETQALDTMGTVSAFQADNGLALQSRGDVQAPLEGDEWEEEY